MSTDCNIRATPLEVSVEADYAIVWSRFNQKIVAKLLSGAKRVFQAHHISDEHLYLVEVPGAWEIGYAAQRLAHSHQFDAIIVLGAIIRGDTPHFDYVAHGATHQLARVILDAGIPVILGMLTTDTEVQAYARAGGQHGNKGVEAATTAIEMVALDRMLTEDGIAQKRP